MMGDARAFRFFLCVFCRNALFGYPTFFLCALEYLRLPSLLVVQGRWQGPESTTMGKVTWLEVNYV